MQTTPVLSTFTFSATTMVGQWATLLQNRRALLRPACLLLFMVFGATACSGACASPEKICTTIGCGSGLSIQFPGWPNGKYTMIVVADGKEHRRTCRSSKRIIKEETVGGTKMVSARGGPCGISIVGQPSRVRVTFIGKHGRQTRTFRPRYKDRRPNGPGCEPVCKQARIEFGPLP